MYNITANNNIVKYTTLSIPNVGDGVRYYDGTYSSTYTFKRVESSANGIHDIICRQGGHAIKQDKMLVHVYGTITRDDMTDNCVFYHYLDEGTAQGDVVIFIPCNLQDNVTHVDFQYFMSKHQYDSNYIWTAIYPCDGSYNKVSSPNNINITVDCYSF